MTSSTSEAATIDLFRTEFPYPLHFTGIWVSIRICPMTRANWPHFGILFSLSKTRSNFFTKRLTPQSKLMHLLLPPGRSNGYRLTRIDPLSENVDQMANC